MGKDRKKDSLSETDLRLWQDIARSVEPIAKEKPGRRVIADTVGDRDEGADRQAGKTKSGKSKARAAGPRAAPSTRAETPARTDPELPLSGVDRRTRQKLGRGQISVDATIDLHGLRQLDARGRLLGFFERCRARGLSWALVITGKGAAPYARHTLHSTEYQATPERGGVLRAALPEWLSEPEFRALVSGFQPAHPKHGGGGAFYVRIRRDRGRKDS